MLFFLFLAPLAVAVLAQAGVPVEVRSILDVILQYGMAGIVLVVVYLFLQYLKSRDARDERTTMAVSAAEEKIADKLEGLGKSIASLDTAFRVALQRQRGGKEHAADE